MGVDIHHAGRPGAAAADWWDPNGDGLCVWAAYQPKGAANQAASYVDLSGNGNNAGVGVAPTWDAVNGWKFNGVNQYLTTTFVPQNDQSQSVLVQFTNVANTGGLVGLRSPIGEYIYIRPNTSGRCYYIHGAGVPVSTLGGLAAGNSAIAGAVGYRNGAADIALNPFAGGVPALGLWIAALNNLGAPAFLLLGYIQALAIYDCTLTAPQVLAVAAAMSAL